MGKATLLPTDVVLDSKSFSIRAIAESIQKNEILIVYQHNKQAGAGESLLPPVWLIQKS